jgi:hypothetical protein
MKILKATKVFLEKLITKIISIFKKKEEPLSESVENTVAGYAKTTSDLMIQEYKNRLKRGEKIRNSCKEKTLVETPLCGYEVNYHENMTKTNPDGTKQNVGERHAVKVALPKTLLEGVNTDLLKLGEKAMKEGKPSIREKYVIMNGKRFLGYVTSKQKLFGILSYDFSTNPKRHISFNTKEEAYKFMADEYRTCFNKMWNIDSLFRYPINGYNQAQGLQLIRYYIKQLNNSKIGTILVCDINGCNGDFGGDTLSTYNVH